jgi:hypothetical protein
MAMEDFVIIIGDSVGEGGGTDAGAFPLRSAELTSKPAQPRRMPHFSHESLLNGEVHRPQSESIIQITISIGLRGLREL